MKCPRLVCRSSDTRVYKTFGPDHTRLKQRYVGLNVVRRQHLCNACNTHFYTIEMYETEYDRTCITQDRDIVRSRV